MTTLRAGSCACSRIDSANICTFLECVCSDHNVVSCDQARVFPARWFESGDTRNTLTGHSRSPLERYACEPYRRTLHFCSAPDTGTSIIILCFISCLVFPSYRHIHLFLPSRTVKTRPAMSASNPRRQPEQDAFDINSISELLKCRQVHPGIRGQGGGVVASNADLTGYETRLAKAATYDKYWNL